MLLEEASSRHDSPRQLKNTNYARNISSMSIGDSPRFESIDEEGLTPSRPKLAEQPSKLTIDVTLGDPYYFIKKPQFEDYESKRSLDSKIDKTIESMK